MLNSCLEVSAKNSERQRENPFSPPTVSGDQMGPYGTPCLLWEPADGIVGKLKPVEGKILNQPALLGLCHARWREEFPILSFPNSVQWEKSVYKSQFFGLFLSADLGFHIRSFFLGMNSFFKYLLYQEPGSNIPSSLPEILFLFFDRCFHWLQNTRFTLVFFLASHSIFFWLPLFLVPSAIIIMIVSTNVISLSFSSCFQNFSLFLQFPLV